MPIPPTPPGTPAQPSPKVLLDWCDWLPFLEASNAPEAQKREMIETLWAIVRSFVDLGWEVGAGKGTGGKDIDLTAVLTAAVVQLADQPKEREDA